MSIAVLNQVYDEVRRLAIAGSVVAGGDFRLKKLLPALEQAGAKAPVFAKVTEAVKGVVECTEANSAQALLDLTVLVNAILCTQGETGISGTLEPIDTIELGAPASQTGARVLKPLVEALTTTGSGRVEVIRDAFERGLFRDFRLLRPALHALDDGYAEIADFVGQKILPQYGKAILSELRAKFDLKGRTGHPRRLQLMHQLDPAGTRDVVKQALDSGSREVKVVAIGCLGAEPSDLSYLLEQARAKAQEVRQAAYRALASIDDEAAVAVLQKAVEGKDLDLAAESLSKSRDPRLLSYLIAAAEGELAAVRTIKDKKEVGGKITRLLALVNCLSGREDPHSEGLVVKIFGQRGELSKIKGDPASGPDFNSAIVRLMEQGTGKLKGALVDAHASLSSNDLPSAFRAAQTYLPAKKVYALFSSYLTAPVDAKKQRDPAWGQRQAIIDALGQRRYYYGVMIEEEKPAAALDPRWLDLAVEIRHLELVQQLVRPGHAGANALLKDTFSETLKKAKQLHECHEIVASMVRACHPEATDAVITVLEKFGKKNDYFGYWFGNLIPELPKSALPRLEALVPNLHERVADGLLGYMQQLREIPH